MHLPIQTDIHTCMHAMHCMQTYIHTYIHTYMPNVCFCILLSFVIPLKCDLSCDAATALGSWMILPDSVRWFNSTDPSKLRNLPNSGLRSHPWWRSTWHEICDSRVEPMPWWKSLQLALDKTSCTRIHSTAPNHRSSVLFLSKPPAILFGSWDNEIDEEKLGLSFVRLAKCRQCPSTFLDPYVRLGVTAASSMYGRISRHENTRIMLGSWISMRFPKVFGW